MRPFRQSLAAGVVVGMATGATASIFLGTAAGVAIGLTTCLLAIEEVRLFLSMIFLMVLHWRDL